MENLLKKYDWITDEKKFFGKPNTAYDFEVNDPVAAEARIRKLQETKDKLCHTINMRAMNMLEKAEEEVKWSLFVFGFFLLLFFFFFSFFPLFFIIYICKMSSCLY